MPFVIDTAEATFRSRSNRLTLYFRDGPTKDCTISVVTHLQQDVEIDPQQVDRRYDLIVKGTADPDASGVTAELHVGANVYEESVAYSGMNWTCTVNHNHFDPNETSATLVIYNTCAGATAIAIDPIAFLVQDDVRRERGQSKGKLGSKKS